MVDFVVIGGGIAGVSAAAHLAPHGTVVLLETESSLAYHTTGRSAAIYIVNYGGAGSRPLALASKEFLENPPDFAADAPLLTRRGALWVATPEQISQLDAIARSGETSGTHSEALTPEEIMGVAPMMEPTMLGGGIFESDARDVDVAGLHQAFVRIIRKHGGTIRTSAPVIGLSAESGKWVAETPDGPIEADAVVNASGAWGDAVASLAGVSPVGLQPMRRTAFMVPGSEDFSATPMVVSVAHDYYFKPDGTQLLCSLAEEVPSDPTDPRPRMEDVALAIERINEATTLGIRTVNSQWTGLRTFAPDGDMVIGEDPEARGFFWLVGLGGTGITTSPAFGALVASQVLGQPIPPHLEAVGVDASVTAPERFR